MPLTRRPTSGDVYYVTRSASPQFAVDETYFKVIKVDERPTYAGWIWLEGYQLAGTGEAVARRSIFVRVAGLLLGTAGRGATPHRETAGRRVGE